MIQSWQYSRAVERRRQMISLDNGRFVKKAMPICHSVFVNQLAHLCEEIWP